MFREFLRPDRETGGVTHSTSGTALSLEQLAPQFSIDSQAGLTSDFSADAYRRAVQRVIDYIHAGDVFQVNLSQRLLHAATSSPIDLYCRLRKRNPAPFAGYLDGGDWQIASASPERFIQVENRHVETRPIKGTRGRSPYPVADMFTGDVLRGSEKDRAENVMIVDLLRNDISLISEVGTLEVPELFRVESYPAVHQMVSKVRAKLLPELTIERIFAALFPCGSITGAPKIRAMEILRELESTPRDAYCGAIGWIAPNGQMRFNVAIRTITLFKNGRAVYNVGGGIVFDKTAESEYQECLLKARFATGTTPATN